MFRCPSCKTPTDHEGLCPVCVASMTEPAKDLFLAAKRIGLRALGQKLEAQAPALFAIGKALVRAHMEKNE